MASYNGNFEMARILIGNGADVNVQNGDDETPLILAERYGYVELANFLQQNGAIDIDTDEERDPKNANYLQQNGTDEIFTDEERGPKNAKFLSQNGTIDIEGPKVQKMLVDE